MTSLNKLAKDDLVEMVRFGVREGCGMTGIDFCSPVFLAEGITDEYMIDPRETVQIVMATYEEVDSITNGKVVFGVETPLCLWPGEFIAMLKAKSQISTQCQLGCHTGLIFGVRGEVLTCNCLTDFPFGQFGKEFSNAETFSAWWTSREVNDIFDGLTTYPHKKCASCKRYNECGGGCSTQWFVRNPKDFIR